MSARKVSQILGADSALGDLAAASRRVEQLQRIYLEAVPAALGAASRVGWARAGVLTILASNSAVAAKLRQTIPRILTSFERHGLQFNSMRIHVQVGAAREAARRRNATLSPQAARTIKRAARELPPSQLKTALERLARRGSQYALEDEEQREHGGEDEREA
jgi:hypothetical protein